MTSTADHTITITGQAIATLTARARASKDREEGGILIGYRLGPTLHIHDALPVADPTAIHSRYLRRNREGQQVLTQWLRCADDPSLGYVGEWHTHPAPLPPSATDLAAARIMSARNRHPVALVVAARGHDNDVSLHAVLTRPGSLARRLVGAISEAELRRDG